MNAADKDQVKQGDRLERRKRTDLNDAWKAVLSTPQGRELFRFILDELQPRNICSHDPSTLAFRASRYDQWMWLREQIDAADPDALITMAQEQRLLLKQETSERDALQLRKKKQPDTEE